VPPPGPELVALDRVIPTGGSSCSVRRASWVIVAVGLGLVLAACGGGLPRAGHYGNPGYRYIIAFAKPPTKRVVAVTTLTDTPYGPAIARRTIWSGGNADVLVDQLTTPVPPARVDGLLRSYLPTSTDGRIVTRFGFPAAIESVPCFTPAGSCPGNIAFLTRCAHSAALLPLSPPGEGEGQERASSAQTRGARTRLCSHESVR